MQIRLTDRNCNFYEALVKTRLCAEGNLKQKIEEFFAKLDKWKKQEQYMPLDELIWQIYLDTGYYQYVGLLPNGAMRQANLKTLFEKAKQYVTEKNSSKKAEKYLKANVRFNELLNDIEQKRYIHFFVDGVRFTFTSKEYLEKVYRFFMVSINS